MAILQALNSLLSYKYQMQGATNLSYIQVGLDLKRNIMERFKISQMKFASI